MNEEKNITTLFTFLHNNSGVPIFNTTNIIELHDFLHYGDGDKELYKGRELNLKDHDGSLIKFKIEDIVIAYYEVKLLNEGRNESGTLVRYNNSVVIYISEVAG